MTRVITRERGVIPGCIPSDKDDHMVQLKKDDIDAYCAELRANTLASRKMRGACLDCGFLPKPKKPIGGWRYCQCVTPKFEAIAA